MCRGFALAIGVLAAAASAAPGVAADGHRYLAIWRDGAISTAAEVEGWSRADLRPSLAGRPILEADDPVRCLFDTTLPRGEPACYVEFHGGDRLPGRVVGYVGAERVAGTPAHIVVEPTVDLGLPQVLDRRRVRVFPEWVRRVVHRSPERAGMSPPVVLIGAQRAPQFVRAVRWFGDGLHAVSDSGMLKVSWFELSQLDTGPWPGWSSWHRQLAVLCPAAASRIVRLELADGTRLTTSSERLVPRTLGGDDPARWWQLVQPAWSLDLLAVPHRRVRLRTVFQPHETPLTAIPPVVSRHQAVYSGAWAVPGVDASVQGGPLRCGGVERGWGYGVHAEHELQFLLPRSARRFRTSLGLDAAAGTGGCARGRVLLGDRCLFDGPVMMGTGKAIDTGFLEVGGAAGPLRLVADARVEGSPPEADPEDIRDVFDWLEPLVEHAAADVQREVDSLRLAALPSLAGWTADAVQAGNWRLENGFDDSDREAPCFRQSIRLDGPLTLTRSLVPGPGQDRAVLVFGAAPDRSRAATVEILLDGTSVLRTAVGGEGGSGRPVRIEVPLRAANGRAVECAVRLAPAGGSGVVDWRGLSLLGPAD